MNFIIDIGNSLTKVAFFRSDKICGKTKFRNDNYSELNNFLQDNTNAFRTLISSVKSIDNQLFSILKKNNCNEILILDHKTSLPIKITYDTPETLGIDRIAAAVGADFIFSGQNILVVDLGTAITFDLIVNNSFMGGNISPGLETRFRSLHEYTGRLPKVAPESSMQFIGTTTKNAIISGVQNGIVYETETYIDKLSNQYSDLKVIFTGGDANFFEKFTKRIIFAKPDLVLIGLNRLLEYNLSTH